MMPNVTQNADQAAASKRLLLCFDGTWNTPETNTNVSRLYAALADAHTGCPEQLKFYEEGVGTALGTRLLGGAFGDGLDTNILKGFCWLINTYHPTPVGRAKLIEAAASTEEEFENGDELFLFGFSRGAFTARSLAGLINRCGIPMLARFGSAQGATIDHPLVQQAWSLYRESNKSDSTKEPRDQDPWLSFRRDNCYTVKIKFVGVWDTVGALGIPTLGSIALPFVRNSYKFHDTALGRTTEYAYHAVAIDEQRQDYEVTLWTARHPLGTREVEQRWFPGAHANVGGGYDDDLLPDAPLAWLATKATNRGIEFLQTLTPTIQQNCLAALPVVFMLQGNEYLSPVRDSYKEFMNGLYAIGKAPLGGRYYRPMMVNGVNETIDQTANLKWAADEKYRPYNLANAGRADINGKLAAAPAAVLVTGRP